MKALLAEVAVRMARGEVAKATEAAVLASATCVAADAIPGVFVFIG